MHVSEGKDRKTPGSATYHRFLASAILTLVLGLIVLHTVLVFYVPRLEALWDATGAPLTSLQQQVAQLSRAAKSLGFLIYIALGLLLSLAIAWRVMVGGRRRESE